MATYVLSDIHGHRAAFEKALALIEPDENDRIYLLGDMVDRGPDPVGVMRLAHNNPFMTVLKGNHEAMMLDCLDNPEDTLQWGTWVLNGGETTAQGLMDMVPDAMEHLVKWVRGLPLYEVTELDGKLFLLTHAGIKPVAPEQQKDRWTAFDLEDLAKSQDPEDLLWIREEFWNHPTGLKNAQGEGPLVVSGHTPTSYLPHFAEQVDARCYDASGHAVMVEMGATPETGHVADKIDIDCAAAGGYPAGQIGVLRLDDGFKFYVPIEEGE